MRKRTKIICTIGPVSRNDKILREMIKNGMNVARFNFSHMTRDEALEAIGMIKKIRKDLNVPLPIMLDTKGPEVRLYGYKEEIQLNKGDTVYIESYEGDDISKVDAIGKNHFYTNLPTVTTLGKAGARVLFMDGFIDGEITDKTDTSIVVQIRNNGVLRPRAHFAIPNVEYPLQFLSEQDKSDILFASEQGFEYIALSFVNRSEDVGQVRRLLTEINPENRIMLIAKIENRSAVENLSEIIDHADGVMVARGDLGVELDVSEVPLVQKKIIKMCYQRGKPVITATQMLESMIENPIPTRAEASDVANACFDLTSAVMLSGETAVGNYPGETVATMTAIINSVEESFENSRNSGIIIQDQLKEDLTAIVNSSAVSIASAIKADAIVVVTTSGYSARMLSKMRSMVPIWAFTYDPITYRQLELSWGVIPKMIAKENFFEAMVSHVKLMCLKDGIGKPGSTIVIVGGLPMGKSGTTNTVRVETL